LKFFLKLLVLISIFFFSSLSAQIDEYEIKSIVIHKILNFVKWPESSKEPQFVFGVIGKSAVTKKMAELATKVRYENRNIVVVSISSMDEIKRCNALFVAPSEASKLDKIVEAASGKAVLLISDYSGFGAKGIHINLFLEENRVKFEINKKTLDLTQLKLSAKLYKLARIIE